jgi:hypothetical protein
LDNCLPKHNKFAIYTLHKHVCQESLEFSQFSAALKNV